MHDTDRMNLGYTLCSTKVSAYKSMNGLPPEHQELIENVLTCYFLTCGESSRERFETDAEFEQSLRTAALSSMAIIALACSEDDQTFQKLAPQFVGAPQRDTEEVAMLRVFTLDNFVTDEVRDVDGATERLEWLRQSYIHERGGATRTHLNAH